jgi:tetratricopeptide (TPR) repeat protein
MNVIAKIMEKRGKLKEAERYRVNMVKEFSDLEPRLLALSKAELAALRIKMGKTENARECFLNYLQKLDDSPDDMEDKSRMYQALCSLAEKEGDYRKAFEYCSMKADIDRKIDENERKQDIVRIRLQSEYEYSEKQRILLEKQKESLEKANAELEDAMSKIKTLRGMLPICAHCKKIRNDKGYWERIEQYITDHSDAVFSHGLCPQCRQKLYPEYSE